MLISRVFLRYRSLGKDTEIYFKIQKRVVRILCSLKPCDSCRVVFKSERFLTLTNRYLHYHDTAKDLLRLPKIKKNFSKSFYVLLRN